MITTFKGIALRRQNSWPAHVFVNGNVHCVETCAQSQHIVMYGAAAPAFPLAPKERVEV